MATYKYSNIDINGKPIIGEDEMREIKSRLTTKDKRELRQEELKQKRIKLGIEQKIVKTSFMQKLINMFRRNK